MATQRGRDAADPDALRARLHEVDGQPRAARAATATASMLSSSRRSATSARAAASASPIREAALRFGYSMNQHGQGHPAERARPVPCRRRVPRARLPHQRRRELGEVSCAADRLGHAPLVGYPPRARPAKWCWMRRGSRRTSASTASSPATTSPSTATGTTASSTLTAAAAVTDTHRTEDRRLPAATSPPGAGRAAGGPARPAEHGPLRARHRRRRRGPARVLELRRRPDHSRRAHERSHAHHQAPLDRRPRHLRRQALPAR